MAKQTKSKTTRRKTPARKGKGAARGGPQPLRWLRRWLLRGLAGLVGLLLLTVIAHSVIRPWGGAYMLRERLRLGEIDRTWVPIEEIAPVMARSVVAAEDANFCLHWGIDMSAIRDAIADGAARGGSTITQQVVKNVYLWHGRSYVRKALETLITPVVELTWSKRRILEVYLNVAEFDEGAFGIEAGAWRYFQALPKDLSAEQAARLAAVLPSPQSWSASAPGDFVTRRSAAIRDGAATIARDGRAACFED
ncbi:monofunctional biosynthetic peptidoglycan transglycosylase [Pseudooceanicola sp. 200-1SW]|uniref:monofunctional biosynthetic peptidoglycan transglycosylase n=1 Tax=Pseudooceanicola sp. 200-1SW TaxID=3425949 RepID=UPI003D7F3022